MKSKLILTPTATMSEQDWLAHRLNGIGGSEIGAVCGLNPWLSNVKLFYQKLQEADYPIENEAMFWGTENEETIADTWQYYNPKDPDTMNYIKNKRNGKIIRRCRKVNSYITHPDYPFAFASVDRLINKGDNEQEGILECKTISVYAAKNWTEGIPAMHMAQLQWYMMILEVDYGELATLKDGRYFEVIPFERNDEFIKYLLDSATDFWDRVTRARILKQEGKPYEALEPESNNQEAYKIFLSERYKAEPKKIAPEMHCYDTGIQILVLNEQIKALEETKTGLENKIKEYMKESDTMDFGASGKITWKEQKGKVKFNSELFKETHPELYDKFVTFGDPFRVLRIGLKVEKSKKEGKEAA
jgi:putative phage-type endonuclease